MAAKTVEQASIPSTMRAWTYTQPGHPKDILTLMENFPLQHDLKPNEVLVKISHCGFNAGVVLIMEIIPSWLFKTPKIPELDFSGEILATAASTRTDLPIGTKVFGSVPPDQVFRHGRGTLAEYVVLPTNTVMPIPRNMPPEQAACLSGCSCTSLQIVRKANLKLGDTVLINGSSGGLGSILVQIVKATIGPTGHLIATCSAPNVPFVTSLGADEVIDYTAHTNPSLASHLTKLYSSSTQPPKFDAILDTVGLPSLYTSSPSYLKSTGLYLNAGGMSTPHHISSFITFIFTMLLNSIYPSFLPHGVPRRYAFLSGNANEKDHREVKALVEEGKLRVELDSVWGMGEALQAYERIESQRARGKVVVSVWDL